VPDYDAIARFYDLDHVDYVDDLDTYYQLARATGGPVLDVGTGTGRVSVYLAQRGVDVTGVDESEVMLERARSKAGKAARLRGRLDLVRADARQLDLGDKRFRLAIVALNTFAHFLTAADQFAALISIRRHLDHDGLIVLDLHNPTSSSAKEAAGEVLHGYTRPEPGTENLVTQLVATTADQARQLLHVTLWYDVTSPEGQTSRTTIRMTTRYCYRYELEWMLLHAGLDTDQVYGDYDLSPYSGAAPRLLVTARVAPHGRASGGATTAD